MASSVDFRAAVAPLLLFGCGAAAATAWRHGLLATGLLVLVSAVFLAGAMRGRRAVVRETTPSAGMAREAERQLLATLLDQVPTALVSLDGRGGARALNREARRLLRTDDAIAASHRELLLSLQGASPGERQRTRVRVGGADRAYGVSVADVVTADGPLRIGALIDLEGEIQATEAAALNATLKILSHEIMNSLTPVASLSQTAAELLGEDPPQVLAASQALDTLARRAAGLERFVETYRELTRLPPPRRRRVSVPDVLQEAGVIFRSRWLGQGVELIAPPPPAGLTAMLDPDLIGQALINLLSNAAEAALEGGSAPPQVTLTATEGLGGVEIRVGDNGPGVDPGAQANIFQPFFTTKPGGSGVGLSLARQIAASHGGSLQLEVRSGPEKGASFVLSI